MFEIHDHALFFTDHRQPHRLRLCWWDGGVWQPLALRRRADHVVGEADGIEVILTLTAAQQAIAFTLTLNAQRLTRVQLALEHLGATNPFHLIPANIHGDNALAHAEPGHLPNLTLAHGDNISCSPYWELRADRSPLPVSFLLADSMLAAVAINPYSDVDASLTSSDEGFIRNGVFARLAHANLPDACGVTLGYRNTPLTFLNKDQWLASTEHRALHATAQGRIYLRQASSRVAVHEVIRDLYQHHRQTPQAPLGRMQTITALTDAFLKVNWQEEYQNFSNMHCTDRGRRNLKPWRSLAEIGWTGGGVLGYPLLRAGEILGNDLARQRGMERFDWIARAFNEDSGLLWDVCGEKEGKRVNWWWSGYLVKDVHCAYTNGSGLSYLMQAYDHCHRQHGKAPAAWLETACRALDTIVRLQLPSGSFGYTYRTDRPEIVDPDGYAGVWFIAALALAYRHTRRSVYLAAAETAIGFYHEQVRALTPYGTPMDTFKSVDQEGNLGLIRGAAVLHQVTGDQSLLAVLRDAADYEYLWRYGFQARPQYAPLKDSPWNSCGGSITSVSNPHIHPMGLIISAELRYLAQLTGDLYDHQRCDDGLNWAINSVALIPDVVDYAPRGVLTERFCPSDGLAIENNADASRSSLWYSYNGWAAASALEALVDDSREEIIQPRGS